MKLFNLNIRGLVLRLYTFMWFVIVAGLAGLPWAVTLTVSMLIFLTGMWGIPFHAGEAIELPARRKTMAPRHPQYNLPRVA